MRGRDRRAEALALLGLARRAGALVQGTDGVREALRGGRVRLLILAEDGSEVQRRKVLPLAEARGIPWVSLGNRSQLGAALGAGPLAAVALTDPGLARAVQERLEQD